MALGRRTIATSLSRGRRARSIGEGFGSFEVLFRNCVRCMGSYCRGYQFMALPLFDKPLGVGHRFSIGLVVGNREINDCFT